MAEHLTNTGGTGEILSGADTPAAAHERPGAGASLVAPAVGGPGGNATRLDNAGRQVVTGRQSNHGDWILPAELAGTGIGKLWLAVATWSLYQARSVTREDIAQAFRISVRRAADVMTYIMNHQRDKVQCARRLSRPCSGVRVLCLTVSHIKDLSVPADISPPVARTARSKPKAKDDGGRLREMRTWFLTNPLSRPE